MNKLKNLIIKFKDDRFQCSGRQLHKIIEVLSPVLQNVEWYIGDVITNEGYKKFFPYDRIISISNTEEFKSLLKYVDQFMSGVFIALPKNSNQFGKIDRLDTEHLRKIHVPNAILEIRAFDTTFFEVYTYNQAIIDKLMKAFNLNEKDFGPVDN